MEPREKIYDPVRRKYVALTPEEKVRQFVIQFLNRQCGVPLGYMSCESPIQLYGRDFRSDLWVHNQRLKPVLIVECKRPEVALDEKVLEQALKYALLRGERFIALTNGPAFRCFEKAEEGWRERDRYPDWTELNSV